MHVCAFERQINAKVNPNYAIDIFSEGLNWLYLEIGFRYSLVFFL